MTENFKLFLKQNQEMEWLKKLSIKLDKQMMFDNLSLKLLEKSKINFIKVVGERKTMNKRLNIAAFDYVDQTLLVLPTTRSVVSISFLATEKYTSNDVRLQIFGIFAIATSK